MRVLTLFISSILGCLTAWGQGASAVGMHAAPDPVAARLAAPTRHRVVVAGHLYGLNVKTMKGEGEPLIYRENVMAAYAAEVEAMGAAASFQLGDLTRYGTEDEWAVLHRIWTANKTPNFWVVGNHDLRQAERFAAHGGLRNRAVVIGRNKYLCLDAKNIFEEADLDFIRDQLRDADQFDHVIVLMHFRLLNDRDPDPDAPLPDPYQTYTGISNWNRDVVPLLLGKVRYVVTGDHYARGAARSLRTYGAHQLFYVHTSFQYRHQGAMVFITLEFDGPALRIVPHAVGLDLHDDWYEDISLDPEQVRRAIEAAKKKAQP